MNFVNQSKLKPQVKKGFKYIIVFFITILSIQLFASDLPDEKIQDLKVKYKAKFEDGVLKIKDRNLLYQAGEELLTREFENEIIKIEAIYQPSEQINNWMNYLLTTGKLDEFKFFDVLYGDNGVFSNYYNDKKYLYFAFKVTSKKDKKIDADKLIKKLKLYDGLDNKVKAERPKFFKFDPEKKERVYEDKSWTTLPGFEKKEFIWVAFPKKDLKEEAGVYFIELKRFGEEKVIQFFWTLPIKLPKCRC